MSGMQGLPSLPDNGLPSPDSSAVVGNVQVPFKVLQSIYNEITAKTEKVNKSYEQPYKFFIDDFVQLNYRITQNFEQFAVMATNCSVTVYYCDNHKDTWSSFERFKLSAIASTSAVESVLLTYNFMIILPILKTPQSYEMKFRFLSRITLNKRVQNDLLGAPPKFFQFMGRKTAIVDITYIDYTVARSFLAVVDEWIQGIQQSPNQDKMKWLQSKSYLIRKILPFLIANFVLLDIVFYMPKFITKHSDLLAFGQFGFVAYTVLYGTTFMAGFLASFIENSVDNIGPVSYIKISKGDAIEIQKYLDQNKKGFWKILLGIVGSVLFAISIEVAAILVVDFFKPS